MQKDDSQRKGVSASADRATHEPNPQAVSALRVGIADAADLTPAQLRQMFVENWSIPAAEFLARYPFYERDFAAMLARLPWFTAEQTTYAMFGAYAQAMSAREGQDAQQLGAQPASAVGGNADAPVSHRDTPNPGDTHDGPQ